MLRVLDCTLRDGGYYLDWNFDPQLIKKYLQAMSRAEVDMVELGFRFLPKDKFLGFAAYTTDEFINHIEVGNLPPLAVMINADDVISYPDGIEAAIQFLFDSAKKSPVRFVRIATHKKDVAKCEEIASLLVKLGYSVFLNLMQVDSIPKLELTEIAKKISSWKVIEALYFADSFGNMTSADIEETVRALKKGWDKELGFHAHENKGNSLTNSLTAIKEGVTLIDSTVAGMGRGAGNTRTEDLLVELQLRGHNKYKPDELIPLVMREFRALKQMFNWGSNVFYYIAAAHAIHPTYVQEMLKEDRYDPEEIISTINFLKDTNAASYSVEKLGRAFNANRGNENGSWSATSWAENKAVLIIASGPSVEKYVDSLLRFIEGRSLIVLCLNVNDKFPSQQIDAYVACHETRFVLESERYPNLEAPLILPLARVPAEVRSQLEEVRTFDYGLRVEKGKFDINASGCVLDKQLALAYALCIATAASASEILIAGIDGYGASDPRQEEMVDLFTRYNAMHNALPIFSITPTTYPIKQKSIFQPGV